MTVTTTPKPISCAAIVTSGDGYNSGVEEASKSLAASGTQYVTTIDSGVTVSDATAAASTQASGTAASATGTTSGVSSSTGTNVGAEVAGPAMGAVGGAILMAAALL